MAAKVKSLAKNPRRHRLVSLRDGNVVENGPAVLDVADAQRLLEHSPWYRQSREGLGWKLAVQSPDGNMVTV